ncbi:hypothetical protein F5I97DRAFT_1831727 [Phlebopus sp. FC_14]|nr:hypothetical protein F5I97DRAFT_1831727 [Phlebopus sp. FC_14]
MSDRQVFSPFSAGRETPGRAPYMQSTGPGLSDSRLIDDDEFRMVQSPSYALAAPYVNSHPMVRARPQSSGSNMGASSSLSGAVGDMDIPPQLRNPTFLPSITRPSFSSTGQTTWVSGQQHMLSMPFPVDSAGEMRPHPQAVASQAGMAYIGSSVQSSSSDRLGISSRSQAFASTFTNQVPFQPTRTSNTLAPVHTRSASQTSDPLRPQSNHKPTPDSTQEEIATLRKKVRELELINEHARTRIKELENEVGTDRSDRVAVNPRAQTPNSAVVQMSWKARTDARIRLFCSLNRAGNALCSWHDSRRERRAYPPRMAPPGYLNCGCTYEEALFEESLSRHGVGSYYPGEAVRMDPTLRNPLLRLLEERYGYRDGEFERDSFTGQWVEGEGHLLWEQKLASGALGIKRRGEDRR